MTQIRSDSEEIAALLLELEETRATLKTILQQTTRMERRLKVALGVPSESRARKRRPLLGGQKAEDIVEQLKVAARKGEQIEGMLEGYTVKPELQAVASTLGLTNDKLPAKDELIRRIATRVRQGIAVSSGIRGVQVTS